MKQIDRPCPLLLPDDLDPPSVTDQMEAEREPSEIVHAVGKPRVRCNRCKRWTEDFFGFRISAMCGEGEDMLDVKLCPVCNSDYGTWPTVHSVIMLAVSDEPMSSICTLRKAMADLHGTPRLSERERYAESDPVDHPAYYDQGGIETIQVIEAWKLDYCLGNTVKYISRAGKKDPAKTLEDLKKARWYLDREIKKLTREEAGE